MDFDPNPDRYISVSIRQWKILVTSSQSCNRDQFSNLKSGKNSAKKNALASKIILDRCNANAISNDSKCGYVN